MPWGAELLLQNFMLKKLTRSKIGLLLNIKKL